MFEALSQIGSTTIEIVTIIGILVSLLAFAAMLMQWRSSRVHRSLGYAELPILNFDPEKLPLTITVVNTGERQFNLDRVCIWLHAWNSIGQEFDISLTEIGRVKLEDGDKIKKSLDVKCYVDGLNGYYANHFTRLDRLLPLRLEIYFVTTTGSKVPLKVANEVKNKLVAEITRDNKPVQPTADAAAD